MFKVVIGLKDFAECESFPEAAKIFLEEIRKRCEKEITLFWLMCANFIEHDVENFHCALNFEDVRDFAFVIGLVSEKGEILKGPLPEVAGKSVDRIFLRRKLGEIEDVQDRLAEFSKILKETLDT